MNGAVSCSRCHADNREGARFCRQCGAALGDLCAACRATVDAASRFCDRCGARAVSAPPSPAAVRFGSPQRYTPGHLAEKILTSRRALEGERKLVTVMFADLKGSMELLADRDPEEARRILDPVLDHMIDAVHRYEGTVNQAMGRAARGHGQVVAVVGEPGVGKSRLFWELTHADCARDWLILQTSSASYGCASAYLPVIDLLRSHFQIESDDASHTVRDKVAGRLLALEQPLRPALPAFLALLDVPTDDPLWEALDPPQRRQRTLEAVKHLLLRESHRQALLLVFEDLRNSLYPLARLDAILGYLREAEELATALGDRRRLGIVSAYLTGHFRLIGAHDRAVEYGEQARSIASELGDFALEIDANYRLGQAYWALGDYARATSFLGRNVASLRDGLRHERLGEPGPPSVLSRVWLVLCLADLGEFREGVARGEEGIQIAREVDNAFSLAGAYRALGFLYLQQGAVEQAIPLLERALELCRSANLPIWTPVITMDLGSAYVLRGRPSEALPLLQEAVTLGGGARPRYSRSLGALAEGYLLAGRRDDATALAQQGLDLSRERGERANEAWTLRLLGDIAACRLSDAGSAIDYYRDALRAGADLGMRPLMARSHTGLAAVHLRLGQHDIAERHAATATTMFRSMEMTHSSVQPWAASDPPWETL